MWNRSRSRWRVTQAWPFCVAQPGTDSDASRRWPVQGTEKGAVKGQKKKREEERDTCGPHGAATRPPRENPNHNTYRCACPRLASESPNRGSVRRDRATPFPSPPLPSPLFSPLSSHRSFPPPRAAGISTARRGGWATPSSRVLSASRRGRASHASLDPMKRLGGARCGARGGGGGGGFFLVCSAACFELATLRPGRWLGFWFVWWLCALIGGLGVLCFRVSGCWCGGDGAA